MTGPIKAALRPGGTGEPRAEEKLYTSNMLRAHFADLSIAKLESSDVEVSEGSGHNGMSALIDIVAVTPEWTARIVRPRGPLAHSAAADFSCLGLAIGSRPLSMACQ